MSRRHVEGGRSCPGTVAGVLGERCGLAAARWKVAEAAVRLHRSAASATQPHARGQLFKIDCRDWGVIACIAFDASFCLTGGLALAGPCGAHSAPMPEFFRPAAGHFANTSSDITQPATR